MASENLYDPIRKKNVPATPEEHVRQATIRYLLDQVKVPEHLIAVEFPLNLVDPKTEDRVDILVQNFKAGADLSKPWLLVECKAPGEYTWPALQQQLNKYLQILTPQYVMLSLGDAVRYFKLDSTTKRFEKIETLPLFQ
ncbi:MAG: type I restriction enzyme HsdR N-terminal domain-containing protein [Fibrobacter sp.]|nr:type I restriction enzyme HsdR N-terminal domain-containing protein [Fibrobacter sp.]